MSFGQGFDQFHRTLRYQTAGETLPAKLNDIGTCPVFIKEEIYIMHNNKYNAISSAVSALNENYRREDLFLRNEGCSLPDRSAIISIVDGLRNVIFPGYFSVDSSVTIFPEYYAGHLLNDLYDRLGEQIMIALMYQKCGKGSPEEEREKARKIMERFVLKLPDIQTMLLKDVQAGYSGDPAAKSKEEIIFSYPGFRAIYVFRIAHELYLENVPFIPRIMTEYAHSNTGIDINPGATIGEYFFIDHGTGVVIGETTVIGNNVKLYQGVTLGALSTRKGQALANVKRHPTIHDNVTIYSNSTVLGGDTVIGENVIIAGNTFITESIPANTRVSAKSPELVLKTPKPATEEYVPNWEI